MLDFVFFLMFHNNLYFVSTIGGETKAAGENQAETVTATRTHIAGMTKTISPFFVYVGGPAVKCGFSLKFKNMLTI